MSSASAAGAGRVRGAHICKRSGEGHEPERELPRGDVREFAHTLSVLKLKRGGPGRGMTPGRLARASKTFEERRKNEKDFASLPGSIPRLARRGFGLHDQRADQHDADE